MIYLIDRNMAKAVSILSDKDLKHQIDFMYNAYISNKCDKYIDYHNFWKYYKGSFIRYLVYGLVEYQNRKGKTDFVSNIMDNIGEEEYWITIPHIFDEKYIYYKPMILSYRIYLLRKDFDYYKRFWPKLSKQNLDKYPKGLFYLTAMLEDFSKGMKRLKSSNTWINYIRRKNEN